MVMAEWQNVMTGDEESGLYGLYSNPASVMMLMIVFIYREIDAERCGRERMNDI